MDAANARSCSADVCLAGDDFAILQSSFERNQLIRGREDPAANRQHFAADAYGAREVAGNMAQCGEEKIAETMAAQTDAGLETILKKPAQQSFILGQGHHAIAEVTGWQDAVFATQAPRTAAVIRDGDDGREIGNGVVIIVPLAGSGLTFQAAQQCGKACATADGDNTPGGDALKR